MPLYAFFPFIQKTMIKHKNKHFHNELSALSSRDFMGGLTIGMALVSSVWGSGIGGSHLPTEGLVVAGQANMTRQNNNLIITQSSSKLAIDWKSFAIGQGNTVKFVQPSANAVAMNRVLGTDVSVIQGALQSNGQVFLLNPNGILFTPTAQVNVGSLVASTLSLSNANFLAGNYQLEGKSSNAITQQGTVTVTGVNQESGTIALIAAKVSNEGQLVAPRGNVLIGAGSKVTLDLGGPVKLVVEQGAVDALIEQGGLIKADGGKVYLTAQAANQISRTVINHSGITEAQSLSTGQEGRIVLQGGMSQDAILVGGRLDTQSAQGTTGGYVETSAAQVKVAPGAVVRSGHWLIDPTDIHIDANMAATLQGQLASGAASVVTGATGADSGDIHVDANVTWSSGSRLTLTAHNNINFNASLDASAGAGGKVVLEYGQSSLASGNTASYQFAQGKNISLQAGQNFDTKQGSDGTLVNWTVINSLGAFADAVSAPTVQTLQGMAASKALSGNFALGGDIDAQTTSSWNAGAGFTPIGTRFAPFKGKFDGLGHDISGLKIQPSSTTSTGIGFGLFGGTDTAVLRNVSLSGINFSIANSDNLGGLVGRAVSTQIAKVTVAGRVSADAGYAGGLAGVLVNNLGSSSIENSSASVEVRAKAYGGGLVGRTEAGPASVTILNSWASGNVSYSGATGGPGGLSFGGLVGSLGSGTINSSYATGAVTASSGVGGLVGSSSGPISNTFATGSVSGKSGVGGLVGFVSAAGATVTNSYAIGAVTGQTDVGGLIGSNKLGATISGFWDLETSTQASSAGGIGKSSAELNDLETFTAAGWDITDRATGYFAPRLSMDRSKPTWALSGKPQVKDVAYSLYSLDAQSYVYNGSSYSLNTLWSDTARIFGSAYSKWQFGVDYAFKYSAQLVTEFSQAGTYSGIQVVVLKDGFAAAASGNTTGTLKIQPAPITVNANKQTKTYGDTDPVLSWKIGSGALFGKDQLIGNLSRAAGEDVGTYAISSGTLFAGGNYKLTLNPAQLEIQPAPITVNANQQTKTYGEPDPALTWKIGSGKLFGKDQLSGNLSRVAGEEVGTYTISLGSLSAGSNYKLTLNAAPLVIQPGKALDVAYSLYSLDAQSYVYKGSSYSLNTLWSDTARIFGSAYSKWQFGVDYAFKYSAQLVTEFSQAGTYSGIQVVVLKDGFAAAASGNTTGTLKIQPAPITVNANKQTKTYGDTDPVLSWKIGSGALFGKDQMSGNLSRVDGENVGTYPISIGSLSAGDNYKLTLNSASLEIQQRPLYINGVRAFSKYYDGTTRAILDLRKLDIQGILPNDIGSIGVGVSSRGKFSYAGISSSTSVSIDYRIFNDTYNNYRIIQPKLFAEIVTNWPFLEGNNEKEWAASEKALEWNMMGDDFSGPRFVISIVGTGINLKY